MQDPGSPAVSVIVPCRNEERSIGPLLAAIEAQTYPTDRIEVVIADGHSTDGTREAIEAFRRTNGRLRVRVVDNPGRLIPAALNTALAASTAPFLVRMDAHSIPAPDYVERCVTYLQEGRVANVGGAWQIRPSGPGTIARAIAAAAAHPIGAGDARYRIGGRAGPVDTVPFGAFRRDTLSAVGMFDEQVPFDEDAEMNARIRRAGGVIWFDPAIRSVYFARRTLRALARQYWRYGSSKRRSVAKERAALRPRQLVPAALVGTLAVLAAAAPVSRSARRLLGTELLLYLAALLTASGLEAHLRRDPPLAAAMPAALITMHLSYGTAFLTTYPNRRLA